MAKAGGVVITGVKELDLKLAGMPARLQKKLSRQATRKAAKDIVLPDAKRNVPHDTGDLERSLTVRAIKRSRSRVGHSVETKDGFFKGNQFYGGFIEFGWDDKPEGDPFLRPALYGNENRIRKLFHNALRSFIGGERVRTK